MITRADGSPIKPNPLFIGVDFGQAQDYTAIVILERTGEKELPVWQLRHLERLPIGTGYPAQVEHIGKVISTLKARDAKVEIKLIVDQTGVGRPVTDMLVKAELKPIPITITAGVRVNASGGSWHVPKRDLVSVVQVLLQSKRLKIAAGLPMASILTSELLNFKVTFNHRGHDSYGAGDDVLSWREGDHDDTVLATALACWYGERSAKFEKNESSVRYYARA